MSTHVQQVPQELFTSMVTPQFLLRVAGLPITVIDDLHFKQTAQWMDSVLALESVLAIRRDGLVDSLHEAVNTYKEDQVLRRKLINLKRSIFTMRLLAKQTDARQIIDILAPEAAALLQEWLDLCARYQEAQAQGPEILARELSQKRALLKEIFDTPDFRKGILLASPVLDEAVNTYLRSDNVKLTRESRTVERSLLEYLLRMTCKTSPFSTFTSVSLGTFAPPQESGEQDIELSLATVEKQSFTRLNMMLLSRFSRQILAAPDIKWNLPVCLTVGWRILDGKVKYIRRRVSADDYDGQMAKVLDFIQENIILLPVGPLLSRIIDLMKDGHEETLGAIVEHLCTQDHRYGSEEEIKRYLQHLLRLSFLIVPAFQLDIHENRPFAAYRRSLYTIALPQLNRLADDLGEVETLIDTYATATLSLRREILAKIKENVTQCFTNLGQPAVALPQTILYEDTVIKPQRLVAGNANWQMLLQQASELQSLFPVFDAVLPDKLMMRGYFQRRYGVGQRCDDFLAFADTYNQDFLQLLKGGLLHVPGGENELKALANPFNLPEVEQLNSARQEVARAIGQAYAQSSATESKELILDDDFRQAVSAHLPYALGAMQSHTFFSQFTNVKKEPLLIVNQVYSGLTLMFSRFAYCFASEPDVSVAAKLSAVLRQLQPPGAVIAELKGGYEATNLNLHPVVTPYELVCPGELSMRPLDEQIPLEDLFVQDDERTGRLHLYSKHLGKEVIPLYLGFLMPLALPEIQQILLNFSYLTMCPLNLWSGTGIGNQIDKPNYYPRLRYKNIVLQRAMWRLHSSLFPQREPGQSDADFFLTVARWRKALGLPTKVFISSARSSSGPGPAEAEQGTGGKKVSHSYKPFYVDFENYFAVTLLEAATRKATTTLQITEMLPERDHLWFEHEGQHYVSELVFEMNRMKGERHGYELD